MPNETHEQRRTRVTAELRANAKVVIAISKPIAPELPRMLDAQAVATTEDIEAALGRKLPEYAIKRIAHDFYSPTYDSIHFEAIDKPETNDIAVSVWKLSGDALDKQFKELQRLPNVELRHELADDSLRSRSNEAFGHAFIDRKASVVGFVICGRAICKKPEEALTIAKLVRSRLDKLTTGEPAL